MKNFACFVRVIYTQFVYQLKRSKYIKLNAIISIHVYQFNSTTTATQQCWHTVFSLLPLCLSLSLDFVQNLCTALLVITIIFAIKRNNNNSMGIFSFISFIFILKARCVRNSRRPVE